MEHSSTHQNAVVAVFTRHQDAEEAVRKLASGGFDMTHYSIVGQGFHSEEKVVGRSEAPGVLAGRSRGRQDQFDVVLKGTPWTSRLGACRTFGAQQAFAYSVVRNIGDRRCAEE